MGGVELIAVNTDAQALDSIDADGESASATSRPRASALAVTRPRGSRPPKSTRDQIYRGRPGAEMVFITAGMGGGTGTGAAPIVAQVARDVGALTVAVVTKPFTFEGSATPPARRGGHRGPSEKVDTLIVIPNDRLITSATKTTTMVRPFRSADEILRQGIQGITEMITMPASVNLDFTDVRTIMSRPARR